MKDSEADLLRAAIAIKIRPEFLKRVKKFLAEANPRRFYDANFKAPFRCWPGMVAWLGILSLSYLNGFTAGHRTESNPWWYWVIMGGWVLLMAVLWFISAFNDGRRFMRDIAMTANEAAIDAISAANDLTEVITGGSHNNLTALQERYEVTEADLVKAQETKDTANANLTSTS